MGVGHLTIIDYDKIETSNLSRCIFFEKEDVGNYKAETLTEKVNKSYPSTKCNAYNMRVEETPDEEFLSSNVIISGVDNLTARIFLTSISNMYGVPLVDGGMIGNQCRIQNFIPRETACPICIVPALNYGQLTGLRDPCSAPIEEAATPSLMTTTSLVSTLQSSEAVKILLRKMKLKNKIGEPINGVLVIDLQYNRFSNLPIKKNANCFVCGSKGIAKKPVTLQKIKIEGQPLSYDNIVRKIKEKLKIKEAPNLYVKNKGSYINLMKDEDLKKTGINTGNYIHVIFNESGREYKEAIIKLI
jgi:adenylyltransferase/sulfurtransferase